jgi:type I site-specific restriction endonuclease
LTTGVDAQTCKVIVLDAEIKSMTKFKQIVGRGTRINEEFNKLYFTILDFRNVTDLFADKDFDGDPIRVKPVTEETDLSEIVAEEENDHSPLEDELTGEEIEINPEIRYPEPEPESQDVALNQPKPKSKVVVNGIDVSALNQRELYFDKLKIDRSFITAIDSDTRQALFVETITTLSHQLGVRVVAEGVENSDELKAVLTIGVDEIQGYFYSRPLPLPEFMQFCHRYFAHSAAIQEVALG